MRTLRCLEMPIPMLYVQSCKLTYDIRTVKLPNVADAEIEPLDTDKTAQRQMEDTVAGRGRFTRGPPHWVGSASAVVVGDSTSIAHAPKTMASYCGRMRFSAARAGVTNTAACAAGRDTLGP